MTFIKSIPFKRIEFWIVLLLLIRLFHISYPPIETRHSWRQSTVLMPARNFLEVDNNILYPRVDFAGEKTGITGMEFPLLNYLIYLASLVFGYWHGLGRIISLILSSLGTYYFYLLIKVLFDKRLAFTATILLMCSVWFIYSRKSMPDVFSMSLVIAGLYHIVCYFKNAGRPWMHLVAFTILSSLGILAKLPSGYILSLLLLYLLPGRATHVKKAGLVICGIIALSPVVWWYFYWVPHLNATYGFDHFFMGKTLGEGFKEIIEHLPNTIKRFYESAMLYIGFGSFLMGAFLAFRKRNQLLIAILSISLATFTILLFKMGHAFPKHDYYVIPFAPIMALVAAYALTSINRHWLYLTWLLAICLENIAFGWSDFFPRTERLELIRFETVIDGHIPKETLVAINCHSDPMPLYMAHRKGWNANNEQLSNTEYLNNIKAQGCQYLIILKRIPEGNIHLNLPIVFEDRDYKIYRL